MSWADICRASNRVSKARQELATRPSVDAAIELQAAERSHRVVMREHLTLVVNRKRRLRKPAPEKVLLLEHKS